MLNKRCSLRHHYYNNIKTIVRGSVKSKTVTNQFKFSSQFRGVNINVIVQDDFKNHLTNNNYYDIPIKIMDDGLLFEKYPIWTSSISSNIIKSGNALVPFTNIKECIMPPSGYGTFEIRLNNQNEILFFKCQNANLRLAPISFYSRNCIEMWADICEPFLDKGDAPSIERHIPIISYRYNIPIELCEKLYSIIEEPMFAYNLETLLWEYEAFDMMDVLASLDRSCKLCKRPLSDEKFMEFYHFMNELTIKYERRVDFIKK